MAIEAGNEPPWPKAASAWYAVILLQLAYMLSFADRMVMSLLIGPIKRDLAISDFEVSLLLGFAFALFYVLMGLPFGYLADRVNRRNMIVWGIVAWSLATAACGFATGFATLFIARMAIGAGEATLAPCAYSILGDSFRREHLGRAISVYVLGNPIGTGLALSLGGAFIALVADTPSITLPLVGEVSSWRVVFVALMIPGLMLSLLMLSVAEPARRRSADQAPEATRWNESLHFVFSRWPTFLCQLGGTALLSAAVFGSMAWIPTFFQRSHGLPASEAGFYFGMVIGLGGVAGLILGGTAGDRLLARGMSDAHPRVMAAAAILAFLPSVAAPLVDSMALAFALVALAVLGTSLSTGVSATAIQLITPSHLRGQVSAIYILTASIAGIGLGPTAVAAITDYGFGNEADLRYALAILAAVSLPGAAIALLAGLPHYRRSIQTVARPTP